jgi:hypothetical protein
MYRTLEPPNPFEEKIAIQQPVSIVDENRGAVVSAQYMMNRDTSLNETGEPGHGRKWQRERGRYTSAGVQSGVSLRSTCHRNAARATGIMQRTDKSVLTLTPFRGLCALSALTLTPF